LKNLGETIETIIKETVDRVLAEKGLPNSEYIATDNLGEVIEKLAIIHIDQMII
jgi:hypothetical protein